MILTFNTHILSSLIKLHVVSGHRLQYFVKNPFFFSFFFSTEKPELQKFKSPNHIILPCRKIGQGHSRVII